jgi:hypothetical protein
MKPRNVGSIVLALAVSLGGCMTTPVSVEAPESSPRSSVSPTPAPPAQAPTPHADLHAGLDAYSDSIAWIHGFPVARSDCLALSITRAACLLGPAFQTP